MIHSSTYNDDSLATMTDLSEVASVEIIEKTQAGNWRYRVVFRGGAVTDIETVGLLNNFKKYQKKKKLKSSEMSSKLIEGEKNEQTESRGTTPCDPENNGDAKEERGHDPEIRETQGGASI